MSSRNSVGPFLRRGWIDGSGGEPQHERRGKVLGCLWKNEGLFIVVNTKTGMLEGKVIEVFVMKYLKRAVWVSWIAWV